MNTIWIVVMVTLLSGRETFVTVRGNPEFKTQQACEVRVKDMEKDSPQEKGNILCIGRRKA